MQSYPKNRIWNILSELIRLSLSISSISPLKSTHKTMDLVAEKVIEKSKQKCHDDAFSIASNCDIDV